MSKKSRAGYLQVGIETYGGGIWHSWLDRDLSIAGRVVLADKSGNFTSKLIKIDKPILRIPTFAIHCEFLLCMRPRVDIETMCKWIGTSMQSSSSTKSLNLSLLLL